MNDVLWFKDAVFYQVYIRAVADGNGDGHGDFIGLARRLDYFRDLGVDCLWLMPMYPSPLLDDGYDIADYYNIHPDYGTLDDFRMFLAEAHARGLRVIADLVLNHTSTSMRGSKRRAPTVIRLTVITMSGATPIKNIRARASSSSTSKNQTGRGTKLRGNIIGIAFMPLNPT